MTNRGETANQETAERRGNWPTSVQELSEGERLVLWAFRRWVSGPEHLGMLAREFDRQFRREEARPALIALDAALTGLSQHARRSIVYHQPCCACLGADEVCVISIVAALQAGAVFAARSMAQWLVRADGIEAFIAPLDRLAEQLSNSGHDLPYRVQRRSALQAVPAEPAALSLH